MEGVAVCAQRAWFKGYLPLPKTEADFKQVVVLEDCPDCGRSRGVILKDLLRQSDYGDDYEEGDEGGAWSCRPLG